MSFTAEVKEELSRVEGRRACCARAELSALVRVEGTLHLGGTGRLRLEIATETAPVARKTIKLLHSLYGLTTELTVRRSVLHKSNNYLITVPAQPKLEEALADLGILGDDRALMHGVPPALVKRDCCAIAYLRGAFLGGGFVADPHGDFHFELTAETEQIADDLAALMGRFDMQAKVAKRRGSYAVYLKGAEPIVTFLAHVGAHRALLRTEDVRIMKGIRNEINRLVNAETANLEKSADAAMQQIEAIKTIAAVRGIETLPPALREMAELRLANPDATLKELGELADPPLTKSAVYHRIRRLVKIAEDLAPPRRRRGAAR
ncbi:DNA-binding protein WhiA [Coriobacteriia bacterium Es71-Z0120]|uniref:DNA-binding protein WhiA n=1 Tax=Parvivirga hydrogeniphila TaxID=2939460 RepID=UPI002260A631|nr:DNA-binding protein WhiA [Parvivirga hydrogeniphila]MCL4078875.1 DNA-binding protein WhiA [Parvivirga hydrogeniphila]